MSVWDVSILLILVAVSFFGIGYYKGKVDCWSQAYGMGEKSGYLQAMRRLR